VELKDFPFLVRQSRDVFMKGGPGCQFLLIVRAVGDVWGSPIVGMRTVVLAARPLRAEIMPGQGDLPIFAACHF
jgi:hypothetical protein